MKRLGSSLLAVFTALTAAAGFLVPGVISSAQDWGLRTKISTYKAESIQFHPVTCVENSLQLLAGGYTVVQLENGSSMDPSGAYQAALDVCRFLMKEGAFGIPPEGYPEHAETPYLFVSDDKSTSAVLWRCRLYNGDTNRYLSMLIDDGSGKMLSFSISSDQRAISGQTVDTVQKQSYNFSKNLACICSKYYGWKAKSVKIGKAVSQENGSINSVESVIVMTTDLNKSVEFPLMIHGNFYAFNNALIREKIDG